MGDSRRPTPAIGLTLIVW